MVGVKANIVTAMSVFCRVAPNSRTLGICDSSRQVSGEKR